jgi:hypothetical protein
MCRVARHETDRSKVWKSILSAGFPSHAEERTDAAVYRSAPVQPATPLAIACPLPVLDPGKNELLLLVWRASLAIWNFRKMLGRRQCGTNLTVFCDSWLSLVVILSFHRAFHQYTPNVIYFSFDKAKGTYREVYVLTAVRTPPRSQISDVPTHELMEHEMYVKA